jgi:urease accessory protein
MQAGATKRNGHPRKPRSVIALTEVALKDAAAVLPHPSPLPLGEGAIEPVEVGKGRRLLEDSRGFSLSQRERAGVRESGPAVQNAERSSDWLIWQLADSAFPTGGFGHSGGLEAGWQHGEVTRATLPAFLETSLRQCARAALPFVAAAHASAERLTELDQHCEAFLSNHVANRASRLQGRAFWTATTRAFLPDLIEPPELCHLAPVFGVLTCRLGLAALPAARLFLFLHFRGLVSSAVRLGIVGPLEAQSMQHQLAPVAEAAAIHAATLTLDDLAQTAPLLDLWQGAQDRLYSRLFQS